MKDRLIVRFVKAARCRERERERPERCHTDPYTPAFSLWSSSHPLSPLIWHLVPRDTCRTLGNWEILVVVVLEVDAGEAMIVTCVGLA